MTRKKIILVAGGTGGHVFPAISLAKKLKGMGRQVIPMGEELIIEMPGGGGYGNPKSRDRKKIMEDIRAGLISADNVKEYE